MAGSVPSPLDHRRRIRAVLFDLDGTLYAQPRLRLFMALELLTLPLTGPLKTIRRWRALVAYRRAQEHLRLAGHSGSISSAQMQAAAERAGLPLLEVEALVEDWMGRRPLKYLRHCRARGIQELLDGLQAKGVQIGLLSDYPADAKLHALGLAGRFSPVLCTTEPEIDALKPSPRGFLRASRQWQLEPQDVLVIGDRVDADAAGAAAAGMPCVIIGRGRPADADRSNCLFLPSIERLRDVLDTDH